MTSEGQAEASGYYFVCSKESVKVLRQGMTLDFKSRDQIITGSTLEGWEEEDWIQGAIKKEKKADIPEIKSSD